MLKTKMKEDKQLKSSSENFFIFSPKKLMAMSVVIFLLILLLNIFHVSFSKRFILGGNELSHVKLLDSIVLNQTFAINTRYTDAVFYGGKYYSNKPPGYAFLLTPPYYFYVKLSGNYHIKYTFFFAKISNAVLSSLSIIFIFLFLSSFKLSKGSILFGLTAATIGTIFPAYSSLANSTSPSIFLLTASILFFRLSGIRKGDVSLWMVSLFAAAYALIVDYSNGFVLLPLIVLILVKALKQKKLINFALCVLFPAGLLLFYNYHVFNALFVLTYSYYIAPSYVPWSGVKNSMLLTNIPHGLYGLLISPSRGLFLLSPVTLLGVIASWNFFKERNRDLLLVASLAFSGILIMSAYSLWHGGHSVGYRHILPSAIILGMLSSFYFEKSKRQIKMIAMVLLLFSSFTGIMSFFIQLDSTLLALTWKAEPADIHSNFYTELLYPLIKKIFR